MVVQWPIEVGTFFQLEMSMILIRYEISNDVSYCLGVRYTDTRTHKDFSLKLPSVTWVTASTQVVDPVECEEKAEGQAAVVRIWTQL
jgi:hypothetical protein